MAATQEDLAALMVTISADLTREPASSGQPGQAYFLTRVSLSDESLKNLGDLRLVPGMPAERSGQLKSGDRIVAIAQAGGGFMDLNEVPLQNIVEAIRGAPNTMLQLKVISAGAAPNTPPITVVIVRDQIKFKR